MKEPEVGAARIRRLLAEIRADRRALAIRAGEIAELAAVPAPDSRPRERAGALALALDRTYTALESIFERIARSVEGGMPSGADWHRSLLQNAKLAIPNVRPAILKEKVVDAADQLRRFRHFLRHAYAAELELRRLENLARSWIEVESPLGADLDEFEKFLEHLAEELQAQ